MAANDPNFNPSGGTSQEAQQMLNTFWSTMSDEIKNLTAQDFKTQELPLARIKKIMKLDEDVKMISAEAPALFARAAEIFIHELTLRAWIHTEDNKRRTLQRNDIAMAISKYDQFDFLIDIVPRDELKPPKRADENIQRTSMVPEQVQYFFQVSQQQQAALAQSNAGAAQTTNAQTISSVTNQNAVQLQGGQLLQQPIQIQLPSGGTQTLSALALQPQGNSEQSQIIQVQQPVAPAQPQQLQPTQPQQQSQQVTVTQTQQATQQTGQQPSASQQQQQQQQQTQVYTQIVTSSGDVQNIPIQLTPQQIQNITLQMQGKQPGQPIVIQTQPAQDDSTTQSLFQVPLTVGGQQVIISQAADSDQDAGETQVDGT